MSYLKRCCTADVSTAIINNLSMSISEGECVGLVGRNGVGKTTVIRAITQQLPAPVGSIYVNDCDVTKFSSIRSCGYCAQSDTLIDDLTLLEHIQIFGRICGMTKQILKNIIPDLLTALHLNKHTDKLVKHLSGGTRRKLCVLLAVLTEPDLLILDEPTTSVDPAGRSAIARILRQHLARGGGVLIASHCRDLTTHLCTRLIDMDAQNTGQMLETRKTQKKNGFSVTLQLHREQDVPAVEATVRDLFPRATNTQTPNNRDKVGGTDGNYRVFTLPKGPNVNWWKLLEFVRAVHEKSRLRDFEISEF